MTDRRLIEESIPLYDISRLSARQKQGVRTGQIKALHIWPARRPTAAARAAVLATLLDAPENEREREKLERFVASVCTWDASSDKEIMAEARRLIANRFEGQAPRVLDPFAGGGIIPLEGQRFGCETHALELNPVAYLIELCTLVYPQEYRDEARQELEAEDLLKGKRGRGQNRLAGQVKRWGKWVFEEAEKEIGEFYGNPAGDNTIIAYLWARTVKCSNPACGSVVPLVKQFWLRHKSGKEDVALKPVVDRENREISFQVVKGDAIDFDPSKGTSSRGSATCLVCGQTNDAEYVRSEGQRRRMGRMPLAVTTTAGYGEGKEYRTFTEEDVGRFRAAQQRLRELEAEHEHTNSLVPDEPCPPMSGTFNAPLYGLDTWGKLFNPRQALAVITFVAKVKEAYKAILVDTNDEGYAKVIVTYLGLLVDRIADYGSTLCRWDNTTQTSRNTFTRKALPMVWDYSEANPFRGPSGPWSGALDRLVSIIDYCARTNGGATEVHQGTATRLPYPDSHCDAVITDPPYYNAVPYADLSDFFYVWLKRALGDVYPDLFRSPLTPKSAEIAELIGWDPDRYAHKDKEFYRIEMTKAFQEIHRVLKPDGRCTVMFTHKSTAAWETLIEGLLDARLVATASWPLHTEQATRLRAQRSAALASSILLVCKKRDSEADIGYYDQVRGELEERIRERLDFFWGHGIRGSDFFISAIGPALEVFGRYEKVLRLSGERVTVEEFLNHVREIVTDYALAQVLRDGHVGTIDPATRFYVLWRWAYASNQVPYDDGRVLAQALGAEIDDLMDKINLLRGRKNLRLRGPKDRARKEDLGESEGGVPAPLIDVLQRACVLWEREERIALSEFLDRALLGRDESFWSVAQSLSEILPDKNKEKQLLQGLLVSQDRLPEVSRQRGLWEEDDS